MNTKSKLNNEWKTYFLETYFKCLIDKYYKRSPYNYNKCFFLKE